LMKFQTRVFWGRFPLMKEFREGEQMLCWQYAFMKVRPRVESAARFGALT
jgi:hypothetical protein